MSDQAWWRCAAVRINHVNDMNGWESPTIKKLPEKLMMVMTELDEAQIGAACEIDEPLSEELADVAIRLLHILEAIWPGKWTIRYGTGCILRHDCIERLLWPIIGRCCQAVECWRGGRDEGAMTHLERALGNTVSLADALGFDLNQDIANKVRKNAERGRLH